MNDSGADTHAAADEPVDFARSILPILSNHCYHCHGPDQESKEAKLAGFRLDDREDALAMSAIVPGDIKGSGVIDRVTTTRDKLRMPPINSTKPQLSPEQVALLKRWIEQGAEYSDHWSFVKPAKPELPTVSDPSWASNGIDPFIHRGLEKAGLSPSPQAGKRHLIRRVTLDLTGLPPTPEEVEAFVNDESVDAYAKLVDRLIASDSFGEHWARQWLDNARYADSQGFEVDRPRTMWRYRDWVINAYNADMPFDRFTREQLAGDLLPEPTLDQLIATGFHRNTSTNNEGGTDDEEFRSAAVLDRTNTTMEVWMGMTMGCVQCHTHKFDPIYHEEYYQFYAFFNQTADADRADDAPYIQAPTPTQAAAIEKLKQQIENAERSLSDANGRLVKAEREWERDLLRDGRNWTALDIEEATATDGAKLNILKDRSIFVSGENPEKSTYTVKASTKLTGITAVRLEALTDERLPNKGPGRVEHGNFAVSRFNLVAEPSRAGTLPSARYVRIQLPGKARILSLAEVQIFNRERNVATNAKVVQSSTVLGGTAVHAIDGVTNGKFDEAPTTHTATEENPWWEAELAGTERIEKIVLWNRTDNANHPRLNGATVTLLDSKRQPVWEGTIETATAEPMTLVTSDPYDVRFVNGTATYEQEFWTASLAIDQAGSQGRGWAIAPQYGKSQAAVFETATNIGFNGGTKLNFTIDQAYGQQHTLGRFKILVSTQPRPVRAIPQFILDIIKTPHKKRTPHQTDQINTLFIEMSPAALSIRDEVLKLKRELAVLQGQVPTALVMRELPESQQRETYLFGGGSFLVPEKDRGIMAPGTPKVFHPFPEDAPRNRLGLSQWLTHPDNPLTARVQVNRIWEQLFGIGLVETTNDFGFQGSYPSNKPLLDYLAVTYQHDFEWSTKSLIRLIVTSSAYKQSSKTTPKLLEIDPYNRLIARGPRLRLSAEQIRDQALLVAGLLKHDVVGGPSVMPYVPDGMLPQAFDSYVQQSSGGDDVYRRGVYTAWRRTGHYPSFAAFDAPARDICTIKRSRTNTPLQALVTLNDPVYVEAAQGFARLLINEAGDDFEARIKLAFERAVSRQPNAKEVAVMRRVYDAALTDYQQNEAAAVAMATRPRGPLPQDMDMADAAAMTVVGNVILNLDELLNKP